MSYLRNTWYMAAWDDEGVPGKPLARTLLDQPVAIFRTDDGAPAAVLDRCPHRFAPLSAGKVEAGRLVCGYHGLAFDALSSASACRPTRSMKPIAPSGSGWASRSEPIPR